MMTIYLSMNTAQKVRIVPLKTIEEAEDAIVNNDNRDQRPGAGDRNDGAAQNQDIIWTENFTKIIV